MVPKRNQDGMPPRMRRNSAGVYYYDHGPGPDGKRHWERLGTDLKAAKLRWAQIETDREAPVSTNTVSALIAYYRQEHLPKLAERTRKDRRAYLKYLDQTFGHMAPAKVRPTDIAQYLEAHPSPISANRHIATLSVVYRKAMRIGLVDRNPCDGVERNRESARDRYITDAEFLAVKSLCDDWMQAVMDLAYLTGMRLGDLLQLKHRQIGADGIHLRQGKTGRRQIIERTAAVDDVLRRLSRHRHVSGMHVICTRRGQPYTTSGLGAMFRRIMVKAHREGVIAERFTWHDIRAKAATDAEDQGLDPQRLLGHTTRRQTEVYLRSRAPLRVRPVDPKSGSGSESM
jgi:integrase